MFKIERHVVGKKAVKCARPVDGESGEDIIISMRTAMFGAQEASARVVKVVREKVRALEKEKYDELMLLPGGAATWKAVAGAASSKDIISTRGFEILAQIKLAIGVVTTSQAKLIDTILKTAAARAKRLKQKAAGAFCSAGGTRTAALQLGIAAWKDAVEACKEERKEEARRKKAMEEARKEEARKELMEDDKRVLSARPDVVYHA